MIQAVDIVLFSVKQTSKGIPLKLDHMRLQAGEREIDFHYRADSTGDRGVIAQVFRDGDYRMDQWPQGRALAAYYRRQCSTQPALIVDAGANIGASVVYFLGTYTNSFVFSIEPEIKNWHILEINTIGFRNRLNLHGAIASQDGTLELIDPGLSDWGFRVGGISAVSDGGIDSLPLTQQSRVQAICPDSILSHPACAGLQPLIMKIDIEGAEADLFQGETSWMARFPCLVIELHDWMLPFSGSSRNFLAAVAQHDFDLVHRGENTFLFNRALLSDYR